MVSQQTICRDLDSLKIVNDMEPKVTQSQDQTENEQVNLACFSS